MWNLELKKTADEADLKVLIRLISTQIYAVASIYMTMSVQLNDEKHRAPDCCL